MEHEPLELAMLGVSLVVLAAGTAVLASAGAVAAVVATSESPEPPAREHAAQAPASVA